jgi:hypothetical protein
MKVIVSTILAFVSATAIATGTPTPTPPATPAQTQTQGQRQGQVQGQHQTSNSAAESTSNAQGGAGGTAASQGQGSFAIQGCGVAGNGGMSNTNGAGFLGFGFTPEQCYDFQLAQAYAALGAYAAACEVLNLSRAGQRAAKRGVALPTCSAPVPPVDLSPVQPVNVYVQQPAAPPVQREQCDDRVDRAFKQCVSK